MLLVFNELSINQKFLNNIEKECARQRINDFIEFLHSLKKTDVLEAFLASYDICALGTTDGYSIKDWLDDSNVNPEHKKFFRNFITKHCQYIEKGDYLTSEFKLNILDDEYMGLGLTCACELESATSSIVTNEIWGSRQISGEFQYINEEENVVTDFQSINNFFCCSHVEELVENNRQFLYNDISSGQDLWEKRELLFPNLIFCECVKRQLYDDPERYHIIKIMERLQHLQNYFASYDGIYDADRLGFSARSESDTVKSNPTLRNMRYFKKPNGEFSFFFDHLGFTGKYSGGRIYFLPCDSEKKCYIGYIGRHLPTKKY